MPAIGLLSRWDGCRHRSLRRLLEQIGHRGHPVGRDVLENLEHLGPLLEMPDAEFRIAHGLLDQVFAGDDQVGQSPSVGSLGDGLILDPPPGLGPVQLIGGQGPQLLVGLVELQLPVAHLQRLAVPLAELLGQPDRVLLGVEHVERVGGRVDAAAAGEIVLREDPDLDRLRLDAQRLGRERAADFERFLVVGTGGQQALALGRRLHDGALHSLPLHADLLDAKVVLGLDLELERLGVEHDLLARQVLRRTATAPHRRGRRSTAGTAPCRPGRRHPASGIPWFAAHRPWSPGWRRWRRAALDSDRQPGPPTSSRLALAVKLAVEPLTSETAPPRTSFCWMPARPR